MRGLMFAPEIFGSCRSGADGSSGGTSFCKKKFLRFVQI